MDGAVPRRPGIASGRADDFRAVGEVSGCDHPAHYGRPARVGGGQGDRPRWPRLRLLKGVKKL